MPDKRPNPEKLLKRVMEEERHVQRGKLKIYLGAAPGVGKTHEMLEDALQERKKGLDVVIGIVESHGRKEIENLRENFEILPRQRVSYHGTELQEFDLDAALSRNPGLILIDEMAHTNISGLLHEKRWQDIKELLDRGINVYTTLNVQHIESLIDDVSQIIHAPIRETVPDSMLESADTIELVDLPPEELLKRLEEGKVYFPEQASLAKEHFFRKGNLTALRELALRVTAARVGTEVLLYRQGEGIQHIWPTKEKILVCVGPGMQSIKLIRGAKRMATSLQAEWIVVYVETPKLQKSDEKRNSAIMNLRLAEQLGAETRVLTGFDIVKEVMSFARDQNATQIMIWKNIRPRLRDLFIRNLADELVRNSGEIDVYIMTGEANGKIAKRDTVSKSLIPWRSYGITISIIILATIVNFIVYPYLSESNLVMVYLLAVTVIASLGRIGPAILGSILSVLAYDFFFTLPFYSLGVSDTQYFFTFAVMLFVALVISNLSILTRRLAESSRLVENQTAALHTLSRRLASNRGADKLLETSVKYLADTFRSDVLALLPDKGHLKIYASSKPETILDTKEQSVAQWVFELGQHAGLGTNTLPSSKALYVPLFTAKGTIGVLRIQPLDPKRLLTPEQMHLIEECAVQIALALEVDHIHKESLNG